MIAYDAYWKIGVAHPKAEAFRLYYRKSKERGLWLIDSYFNYDCTLKSAIVMDMIKEFELRGGQLTIHEAVLLHHIEYPGSDVFMSSDEIEAIICHFTLHGGEKESLLPRKVSQRTFLFVKRFTSSDVSISYSNHLLKLKE